MGRWHATGSLSEVDLPRRSSKAWQALCSLIDRPWFYRAWVIQEVGLAERAIVTCGKRSLPWGKFGLVAENMSKAGFPEEAGGTLWNNIIRMRMMRRGSWYMGGDSDDIGSFESGEAASSLAFLLITSRYADAENPRDKIYALYGFLDIRDHEVPVEFDYYIPPQELYRRVALWLIQAESLSVVLQMAGMRRSMSGLPSWVPDWSVPQRDAWWKFQEFFESKWSDTASLQIIESPDPKVLHIGAKVVAKITWAGVGMPWGIDKKDYRTVLEATLRDWVQGIAQASEFKPCAFEPFYKAILAIWDSSNKDRQQVAAWFSSMHLELEGLPMPTNKIQPVDDETLRAIALSCMGHRMCLTSTGLLVLGNLRTVQGDNVVYFGGGECLFIVRDEGDCKTFVGDCTIPEKEDWTELLPKEESDLGMLRIL